MLRQIKVTELCKELEEKLVGLQYSEDSLRRYRKVFREFEEYAGDCDYSQSRGTDFLLWKFKQLGGFVTSGEHSKNEMYYFRVIRSLAEYYNFGTLFRRHDYDGEIVWPLPFKEVTEGFLQYEVEYGCSQCHYRRRRGIIKDLILFLDSSGIHILKKYAVACEIEEISPHKIRHTKAMHLTEADVNPIFIRDFLGHTDLKVTEVYSKTSIKMKKAALDKMKPGKDVLPDKPIKDWTEDKSLLDWLNGLMH